MAAGSTQIRILQMALPSIATLLVGATSGRADETSPKPMSKTELTEANATTFAKLALKGIDQEYPNKPSNVMKSADDVQSPRQMHPVFYGSFDWHSSVHGHWMLVRLLRLYPDAPIATKIRTALNERFKPESLQKEADYFAKPQNKSFERMYGWAWTMQLIAELHRWDDADAKRWKQHLEPLEKILLQRIEDYLPKLTFPNRTGVHRDTGFALGMLLDYARQTQNQSLEQLLVAKAKAFFMNDRDYPAHYEPSGHDFFSSGFNEADLMRRVLSSADFATWLDTFLPQLKSKTMGPMMVPVEVSDVTDGHLVHLAGLNLSRAWTMKGIAMALPEGDPRRGELISSANSHAAVGIKYVTSGHYEGEHWLATFAVYHLSK